MSTYKQIKNSIPLIIIATLIIISLLKDVSFNYKFTVGAVLFTITFVVYFLNFKLYIVTLGVTLLLGIFNVIAFAFFVNTYGFSFPNLGVGISFQVESLIIFIVYILIFRKELVTVVSLINIKSEDTEKSKFNYFENRFRNKNNDELNKVLESVNTRKEAKEAAKNILTQRKI